LIYVIGIHLLLIAYSIYRVSRTLQWYWWLNLLKSNATMEGRLTVSHADVITQGLTRQTNYPFHCNWSMRTNKACLADML